MKNSLSYSDSTPRPLKIIAPNRDPLWYTLGFALALLSYIFILKLEPVALSKITDVLTVTAGTLFGFLIASLSILLAISNRELIKQLRKAGKINNLVNQTFFNSLILLLALASGIIYLIEPNAHLAAITCSSVAFSLVIFLRIGWKYRLLFLFME